MTRYNGLTKRPVPSTRSASVKPRYGKKLMKERRERGYVSRRPFDVDEQNVNDLINQYFGETEDTQNEIPNL